MIIEVLPLLAGIFSIALASIVAAQGTKTKNLRAAYAMFAGSVGVWAIFLGLFLVVDLNDLASFFVFMFYSSGVLIPYAFLFFSFAYLSIPVSNLIRVFALLPWLAMTILIAMPNMMISGIDARANNVELVQPVYLLYTIIFVLYVLIGLWFLITRAARARGSLVHRRIVAASLFVGFAGGGYFDIILPLLGNYELIAYGPLFAFVTSAGIFYVIARHGLFDVRLTVVRTVNYFLALLTLGTLYFFVAYVVFSLLLVQTNLSTQVLFNLILTIALALLFQPVKHFFDRWTNQIFYRYTYDSEEVFAEVNRLLTSTTDLTRFLANVSQYLARSLKAKQVFFFVYTNEKAPILAGTSRHSKLPLSDARWIDSYMQRTNSIGILQDYDDASDQELHRFMVSHRLEVIVPLRNESAIIGYLCLGEHQKSTYTRRDLKLLETLSNELVIAIQNALSVHEIKDLNAHLEQRINAATKELRASNAQLQRLDEAKDEFISMASHQLRTPLTSIKGYISMIIDGDVGKISDRQKHMLEEAFISSERMVRLINDFLNVSRLQTGKFVIEKRDTDLAKVVQQEIESLEQNAKARNLKFTVSVPKKMPILSLDEGKIRQVIMNFADNAIYYSKEKSTIKVSLKLDKQDVWFSVKDNGIGVPESEQANLFSKFFRAANARRQRPDGTGVGLYLAKRVIQDHHGDVFVESKEGKGSTFGFQLPLAKLRADK